jgi:hypothetical protein
MSVPYQTIHIHQAAPQKPAEGATCNGCGVCCLTEPCPLGALLSGRRRGACDALRWSDGEQLYRCGAITAPQDVLSRALPHWLRPIGIGLGPLMARLARRWVAAGQGCDSTLEVARPTESTLPSDHSPVISSTCAELPERQSSKHTNHHDKPTSTS